MLAIENELINAGEIGGVARFENDGYMRVSDELAGNSWIITTLWFAEYYIAAAKTKSDLQKAAEILDWVVKSALPSGVLPEQIDPVTGDAVSVSPLTWSHSSFVATVHSYLNKRNSMQSR
jgi:GH15 family glucan-1,4-alpha-glucosidase